jgi:hypothetical protein
MCLFDSVTISAVVLAVGQKPPVMLREVTIPDQCSSSVMLQHIRKELGLLDEDIVFKVHCSAHEYCMILS